MDARTALDHWLTHDRRGVEGRLLSEKTEDGYGEDVADFLRFLDRVGLGAWEASEAHVQTWLDTKRIAVRSRARAVSALSSFYAYAIRSGFTGSSPAAAYLRGRPQDEPGRPPLSLMEMRLLREAADMHTGRSAHRDRLLVYLLMARLRPRQVVELRVDDLHFEQHRLTADVWQKGGAPRKNVPLPDEVRQAVVDYRPRRVFAPPHSWEGSGPLLTSYRGQGLDANVSVAKVLRAVAARVRVLPGHLLPDVVAHSPSPLSPPPS